MRHQQRFAIVTIHDACPAFSKKLFTFTDELESLGIDYNMGLVPFFKEKQDLPRFPNFIKQIKNCKGEIALHGLYHEKRNSQLDDFHTRSSAIAEVEIRAGLEIFQEIGISNPNVFIPPSWRLNPYSTKVLEKLRFKLAEIQEKFILFSPKKKFKKVKVPKVLSWDSYADPKRNIVNIGKNRRHFKQLIEDKVNMIRIALHPRDPVHALNDQIKMIIQLKEQGYHILKYADLARKFQPMPAR
jgi:peptidoglycan/xylan/chitin deacetylase (PgdA/CDA1 family)